MSYFLFLDDERSPKQVTWVDLPAQNWVIVRSYKEFVREIKQRGVPVFVSFDHDLSFEHYPFNEVNPTLKIPYKAYKEKTGLHCAEYLLNVCKELKVPFPRFAVHSMNIIGKQNILNLIKYDQ